MQNYERFAFFPDYMGSDTGGDWSPILREPTKSESSTLGGQGISVVAYSEKRMPLLIYQVVLSGRSYVGAGWISAHNSVPGSDFVKSGTADFLQAMDVRSRLWQEPAMPVLLAMQTRS